MMVPKKSGSVLGGILLIAGSCIGAGMLGLPILTGIAGFFPSLVMFVIAWVFMTLTALLLVEANAWFKRPVNFISMVSFTLGPLGKMLCWIVYLFLFYALLVAYMSLSGHHVSSFLTHIFSFSMYEGLGSVFFVLIFGWVIYLGTRPVDHLNRGLMFLKIVAFLTLFIFGLAYVNPDRLFIAHAKYSLFPLPILIISFGFHNMIPSLGLYLDGDIKRMKQAIIGGSCLVFLIYLLWEILTLGILPMEGANGIFASYLQDSDAAVSLQKMFGASVIGISVQLLAFFAILTSFLAQALSLTHFLGDGLKIQRKDREHLGLCALTLLPPLILSLIYPQLFFKALNFAGGICAVILFGVLPALMVWIGRKRGESQTYRVFGGRPLLLFILTFALFVFVTQLFSLFGHPLFPKP